MSDSPKVFVAANCQQVPITSILRTSGIEAFCHKKPIHELTMEDKAEVSSLKESADVIILQYNRAEKFKTLGLDPISIKNGPQKNIIIPNLYFSGYHPTFAAVKSAEMMNKSFSALIENNNLGPHLDTFGIAAKDLGITPSKLFDMLLNDTQNVNKELEEEAMEGLIVREKVCDISISKWINNNKAKHTLFYSFNHPTNYLFTHFCEMVKSEIASDNSITCRLKPYLSNYRLPIYPLISSLFNISDKVGYNYGGGPTDHDMKIRISLVHHLRNIWNFTLKAGSEEQGILTKYRNTKEYETSFLILSKYS